MEDRKMPFTMHLEELRSRLIICVIAVAIGFGLSYAFKEQIFRILTLPLIEVLPEESHMIFTGLPEGFFTYLKTSLFVGFIIAFPIILLQLWRFVAPGLYAHERRYVFPFVTLSTIFFFGGGAFAYFLVFPLGFRFFINFATDTIQPMPSMREFLSFSLKLLFVFGLIFELPIITAFLARMGIVSGSLLASQRKYAIIIVFICAAILTPPDVITQLMLAGPLVVLYEASVIVARVFGKKKKDGSGELLEEEGPEEPEEDEERGEEED